MKLGLPGCLGLAPLRTGAKLSPFRKMMWENCDLFHARHVGPKHTGFLTQNNTHLLGNFHRLSVSLLTHAANLMGFSRTFCLYYLLLKPFFSKIYFHYFLPAFWRKSDLSPSTWLFTNMRSTGKRRQKEIIADAGI